MSAPTLAPLLGRGLDTLGGLDFVRERLALLGKTVFLLSFGFYLFLVAALVLGGGASLTHAMFTPTSFWHLLASLTVGLLWLLATVGPRTHRWLGALDVVFLLAGCSLLAGMAIDDHHQLLQTQLGITVTVMIRAILVPSRPLRTALLTSGAFVAIIVVALLHPPPSDWLPGFPLPFQRLHIVMNTVLWSVLGVTLATVTSRATYGLRQQVAEATEVGQYTLEEKIGGGGMGEVWRARHRFLIRPAAIKLIRHQHGDPELLVRRFEREARATAALRSPHTVELYDFGVTDDGTLYYVMELLDGLDLDTLIRRFGPLPAERVVHLLRQVCSSLADAHGNGLVHRDIKPANIVVGRAGVTFDFAKVLDFGLVKLDGRERQDDDVRLSTAGSASGTPGFMAPEVVLGEAETDHRVDLYSLGCVAYWLLTGKLVFEGDSAMKVMLAHAQTPPPRPSTRTELPIPAALEEIVMACLEKDPARRPVSAEVLSARLAASTPPWTPERAERWWSTHLPGAATPRAIADILLSEEGRPPLRIGRKARPRG